VKKTGTRKKAVLAAKYTGFSGEVLLVALAIASAGAYYWEYSLDQSAWAAVPETTAARVRIAGLTPGRRVLLPVPRAHEEGQDRRLADRQLHDALTGDATARSRLVALLEMYLPLGWLLIPELLLARLPQRIDIVILEMVGSAPGPVRKLHSIFDYLRPHTLIEHKGPTDDLAGEDALVLLGYGAQYMRLKKIRAHELHPEPAWPGRRQQISGLYTNLSALGSDPLHHRQYSAAAQRPRSGGVPRLRFRARAAMAPEPWVQSRTVP